MCARLEGRQGRPVGPEQFEAVDILRLQADGADDDLDHGEGSRQAWARLGAAAWRSSASRRFDAPGLHAAGVDVQFQQVAPWMAQQVALLAFEHFRSSPKIFPGLRECSR